MQIPRCVHANTKNLILARTKQDKPVWGDEVFWGHYSYIFQQKKWQTNMILSSTGGKCVRSFCIWGPEPGPSGVRVRPCLDLFFERWGFKRHPAGTCILSIHPTTAQRATLQTAYRYLWVTRCTKHTTHNGTNTQCQTTAVLFNTSLQFSSLPLLRLKCRAIWIAWKKQLILAWMCTFFSLQSYNFI